MGSGRGDRNQFRHPDIPGDQVCALQWGPVVVTGISLPLPTTTVVFVVASMGSGRGDRNQK